MLLKKTVTILALFVAFGFTCGVTLAAEAEHGFDTQSYLKLAKQSIGLALKEKSPDSIKANAQKMLAMAKEGCEEHMEAADTPADEKKLMALVLEHADSMARLSLEEMDTDWHEGGKAKAAGIDIEAMDHFSEAISHYDAVLQPSIVIILVNDYEKTGNPGLMEQVVEELKEIVEHMDHLH